MSTPFLGSLMSCSWNYAAKGFVPCNGQLLPISQYQALFSLLGTVFGGDGRVNFGLPNLQDRTPVGSGAGQTLGQSGGEVGHTLTIGEMPSHNHTLSASGSTGTLQKPFGNSPAVAPAGVLMYGPFANTTPMNPAVVGANGSSQAHENRQPFLVINWVIALTGIFPSQN